jgi:thioredoxin 1
MNSERGQLLVVAALLLVLLGFGLRRYSITPEDTPNERQLPSIAAVGVNGTPGLIELGSDTCASCRAMISVLEELRRRNGDALRITSYDVYKERDMVRKWRVRMIPTIVFIDGAGNELSRHVGYLSAEEIERTFIRLELPLPAR